MRLTINRTLIGAGVALTSLLAGMPVSANAPKAAASGPCNITALRSKAPAGTTIASAAAVVPTTAKLPEHCLVKGSVATAGNSVDFQLALPKNWNGKFFFEGVGGFAGAMGRLDSGLERGYATATTDTGHRGSSGVDGSWALDSRPKEIEI